MKNSTITYTVNSTPFLGENNQYHYFYKITNKINGKFYYGIHSTKNLDDGYAGSGNVLNCSEEKYGIENFHKEILEFFDTRKECSDKEEIIVTEELIKNPLCYNRRTGGENGSFIGDDIKEKISRTLKEGYKNNRIKKTFLGKHHSEENKKLLREQKINMYKNNPEKKLIGNKNPMYGKYPWNKGLKLPGTGPVGVKRSDDFRKRESETKIRLGLSKGGKNSHAKKIICLESGKVWECIKYCALEFDAVTGKTKQPIKYFKECLKNNLPFKGFHFRILQN